MAKVFKEPPSSGTSVAIMLLELWQTVFICLGGSITLRLHRYCSVHDLFAAKDTKCIAHKYLQSAQSSQQSALRPSER